MSKLFLIFLSFLLGTLIFTTQTCMYAYANPDYEDFTAYTEVDPNSHITVTATRATFTELNKGEDCYLYDGKGVDLFGDFTIDVDLLQNNESNVAVGLQGISSLVLSNDLDDTVGLDTGGKSFISIRAQTANNQGGHALTILECDAGTLYEDTSPWTMTDNTVYFIRMVKIGTVFRVGVYTTANLRDAGDGADGDEFNLNLVLQNDYQFRYIGVAWSWNGALPTLWHSGYWENLDLHEADVTLPTYNLMGLNSTLNASGIQFTINLSDNVELDTCLL